MHFTFQHRDQYQVSSFDIEIDDIMFISTLVLFVNSRENSEVSKIAFLQKYSSLISCCIIFVQRFLYCFYL